VGGKVKFNTGPDVASTTTTTTTTTTTAAAAAAAATQTTTTTTTPNVGRPSWSRAGDGPVFI
jgi:Tfp pilus assembly major pilin PilA